jgi:RNA polymerase sigma factor (sigma-70 family)
MKNVKDSRIQLKEDLLDKCTREHMGAFITVARSFADSREERREIITQSLANVWKCLRDKPDDEFSTMNLKAYICKAVYREGLKYQKRIRTTETTEDIDTYLNLEYQDNDVNQFRQTLANSLQQEETADFYIEKAAWVKSVVGEEKFEILMMWGVDEMSYEDIATATKHTVAAIRNIIFNARKKLQQLQ